MGRFPLAMLTRREAHWAREQLRFLAQNARISHHGESDSIKRTLVLARRLSTSRTRRAVPVYWDRNPRTPNFGDELTPLLVENTTGRQAAWSPVSRTALLGAGSILEALWDTSAHLSDNRTRVVAGTGFMWADSGGWPPCTSVQSVRGHLTRMRLGKGANALAVGDLGLITSMVFPQSVPVASANGRILLIPHRVDAKDPIVARLRSQWPNSEVADTWEDPVSLAARIANASIVVSTALHPLVVADSYRIPNVWLKISNRLLGRDFKFKDYVSVFDFDPMPETPDSLEVNPDALIDRVVEGYSRPYLSEIQQDVSRSFIRAIDELDELRS